MEKFVALLFSGVAYGAVLAIVSLGFLVLYKATGVINFAHGDLVTLGAYLAAWFISTSGIPIVLSYVIAIVAMFLVGVVLERVAHAPLRKRPVIVVVIATLAASIVIEGIIAVWQGSQPVPLPSPVGNSTVTILGASISDQRILIIVVAFIAVTAMVLVFQRTSFGRQLRALASDQATAQLQGIRVRPIAVIAFGLSAALAALAGVLVGPLSALTIQFGFNLMVLAFAAAVIGGFGSIGGAIVGSLIMGLTQQLLGGYIFTEYANSLPFILLFIVIVLRPTGLFNVQRARL